MACLSLGSLYCIVLRPFQILRILELLYSYLLLEDTKKDFIRFDLFFIWPFQIQSDTAEQTGTFLIGVMCRAWLVPTKMYKIEEKKTPNKSQENIPQLWYGNIEYIRFTLVILFVISNKPNINRLDLSYLSWGDRKYKKNCKIFSF